MYVGKMLVVVFLMPNGVQEETIFSLAAGVQSTHGHTRLIFFVLTLKCCCDQVWQCNLLYHYCFSWLGLNVCVSALGILRAPFIPSAANVLCCCSFCNLQLLFLLLDEV